MLKAENLLSKTQVNQTEGVYYGLVDGYIANYSEETLNVLRKEFGNSGVPNEFITNETLSTITCSNISTLSYIDYDALVQGNENITKTQPITSYIKPTAIQYWDQVCNVESITADSLVAIVFGGITSLELKEKEILVGESRGGYIVTRLDTNKSIQLYQSSEMANGVYHFDSADSTGTIETNRLLTTKDIGKTIPFKIEWSPTIP